MEMGEAKTNVVLAGAEPAVDAPAAKKRARTSKASRTRKRVAKEVNVGVGCVADAMRMLLQSDLGDRFLRVQRLAKLAQALQLETSDRVAQLQARGGAGPLIYQQGGGGIYGGLAQEGDDPLAADYGNGGMIQQIGLGGVGGGPVPDNIQLMRELIGGMKQVANPQLPAKEATPYELSSALDVREKLLEAKQDTAEVDAYIASVKLSLKRQAEALEKGEPSAEDVLKQAKLVANIAKGAAGGAQLGGLVQGVEALGHEWANGNAAIPHGLLKAPVAPGGEND